MAQITELSMATNELSTFHTHNAILVNNMKASAHWCNCHLQHDTIM